MMANGARTKDQASVTVAAVSTRKARIDAAGAADGVSLGGPLRIMVASSVYGFETDIAQICAVLEGYGYKVLSSHLGTIPVHPGKSNLDNCLAAVASCDVFFGIIRPVYGSGVVRGRSITHEEMLEAVRLGKPRWLVVHDHVTFARQILRQYRFVKGDIKKPNPAFMFQKTAVLDDVRVLELYEDVVQSSVPVGSRTGHWVQEFRSLPDILTFIQTNLGHLDSVRNICEEMAQVRPDRLATGDDRVAGGSGVGRGRRSCSSARSGGGRAEGEVVRAASVSRRPAEPRAAASPKRRPGPR